ncbi:hypothetical protein EZV62_018519 [Acer yangbiense]|uniref:CDT1 Geminin-binding domain-containing protein n=1 Tax=Acer yangbiense TaxID=1000413 RepID=A0A5C7HLQ4_9ROSI|nr:hypothetical protein EZV62_018519 [Acer yangbiense]
MRWEGAPKERELLRGRIIDRPIRPLFPAGFYHEVQVMASVLSSDGKQDPDVMAANATSATLMLSDVPWGCPIGVIRIGKICGQFVVNPTVDEVIPDIRYRQLCEFFDSLDSAIQLLKLKRLMSTFTNISPKIECLTDRRFSYSDLAQLKFLLPEAIEIKKVIMFDEKTSCMKPDLHVSIDVDAIE